MAAEVALYSAVDGTLTHYAVDVAGATLERRSSVELPAKLQYAWRHPSRPILYATTSSSGPRQKSDRNHVSALAIAPDGALRPIGDPRPLPFRAVHCCTDPQGRFLLNGHNFQGGGITVYRLRDDGAIGEEIAQDPALDCGIYPHQVRVFPSGRTALIVDRGINPQGETPERPGALRSFAIGEGRLAAGQVIAPQGGYGFGPRHVDFHPTQPWLYASDERTNRLHMLRHAGDVMEAAPGFTRDSLAKPDDVRPRQLGGAIRVHPDGRTVYMVNRADRTIDHAGWPVFGGGENNVAVFSMDPATGEPRPIQHADTRSFHVRTFAIDPGGRLLVTASIKPLAMLDGGQVRQVAAALSLFRIARDGTLDFVRHYDVATPDGSLHYWMGMVPLA